MGWGEGWKILIWEFTEKSDFGGVWKTNILGANCLKMEAWIVGRFKRGLSKKIGVDAFEVGLRLQYTLWVGGTFLLAQISKANNIETQ